MEKKEDKLKILGDKHKNLTECYYLLLKKFKMKSTYVLDEFLIKEKKEKDGILSIYEDVNIEAFHFFILSLLDSEYNNIKQVNLLNVKNCDLILKALCFYMDNVEITELLKKNEKSVKVKNTKDGKDVKSFIKNKGIVKKEIDDKNKEEKTKGLSNIENRKTICDIRSLSIFNSNLNSTGILFLAKSLYDNGYTKLEHLSIDCNPLTHECIRYLSLSLCNYNNLKSLSLQYCNLKDNCIKYITNIIIYVNSTLRVLNLCGNRFTEEGMITLFQSFLLNTSLTNIDVSYNMFNISGPFVSVLGKIIENNMNIKTILAIGNFIEKENLEKINDAMNSNKSIAVLKLPQGLKQYNKAFLYYICHTYILQSI